MTPSISISLEMQKTHVNLEHKRYLKAKGLYTLNMIVNIREKNKQKKMHESTLVQCRDVEPTSIQCRYKVNCQVIK